MKHGDFYRHYKGGEYFFDCIALPTKGEANLSKRDIDRMTHTYEARHHGNGKTILLFESGGATFIDSDIPHVIYQKREDHDSDSDFFYAREVDDFFTCAGDGKRFELIKGK